MTDRSLVVVTAGLSQPSSTRLLGDRLAAATELSLRELGETPGSEVIEVREHAQDLLNHLLTGFPPEGLRKTIDAVIGADGVIAVTPIFSASYSGLFKLFFDVIEHEALAGVPVLIGATGGTARHSLALEHSLRPLFTYLGGNVMRTAVYAASEDWGASDAPADANLVERISRAAGELAAAMSGARRTPAPDPYENPIPFEQLLRPSAPEG